MRSAAEGEHRTGEDVGEAVPLMPLEAIQPIGKGEVKGNARRASPRSQSGKNRRGMQPEGGCESPRLLRRLQLLRRWSYEQVEQVLT